MKLFNIRLKYFVQYLIKVLTVCFCKISIYCNTLIVEINYVCADFIDDSITNLK